MLGSADGKSNKLCVTRIITIENWTFKIPPKYLDCEHHVDLIKTAAFAEIKEIHYKETNSENWYSCTLLRRTADAEWTQWRDSFCNTFINKGWSSIKYAMQYKYISGSLLEYSIKKEKLLLQIRKTIDSDTLIDLIAMGPPNEIIEKIDREKSQRPEDFHNEMRKLEYLDTNKNKDTKKTKLSTDNKKNKTPCKICKDKENGTRFHPEDECWFKDQNKQGRREKNINNLAYEARIDLTIDKYCCKRPYRCTINDKKEIEEQISKRLERGLIEESYSPFAAPVTLAFKKYENKKSRPCIDFRELVK
ncbi:hypothetical protein HHI36_023976 [Cryptolaemus montrouzieri]|uniref:Polyprotein n=1 Tax=Cryptolaemus montrouzieri TaxID=559131 RepID=A0ABD2NID2_9CUCU